MVYFCVIDCDPPLPPLPCDELFEQTAVHVVLPVIVNDELLLRPLLLPHVHVHVWFSPAQLLGSFTVTDEL